MPAATARAPRVLSVAAALALAGVTAGVLLASGAPAPPPVPVPAADVDSAAPATGPRAAGAPLGGAARPAGAALVPARVLGESAAASPVSPQAGAAALPRRANAPADFVPAEVPGLLARAGTPADWAPDGSRYAVAVGSTVVSRRADGSGGVLVASKLAPTGVAWSRDGLRIAVTTGANASARLLVTSPLGGPAARVTLPGGNRWAGVHDATWAGPATLVAVAGRPARLVRITLGSAVAVRQLSLTGAGAPAAPAVLADPAVSPDGTRLAYREVVPGGAQRLLVVATAGGAPRVVARAPKLGRPVWSADGAAVWSADPARRSASVVERVVATGAARTLATLPGAPVLYRPAAPTAARAERVQGTDGDLVRTLVAASKYSWAAGPGQCARGHAQTAVLVPAGVPAKALAAAALAGRLCGPVLAVRGPGLDAAVLAELRRVLAPAGRAPVQLVGSAAELPAAVERAVRGLGRPVARIANVDVQGAALAVAQRLGAKRVLLVAPDDLASAAAAAAPAHGAGAAVLFTRGRTVDRAVMTWLSAKKIGAWAVGTRAQRAAPWAARLGGADPVATALAVARTFYFPTYWPLVAAANDRAGSVAGALIGSAIGVPVLLTTPGRLAPALRSYLDAASGGAQGAAVLGSARSVPAAVLDEVRALTRGAIPRPAAPGTDPSPDPSPSPTASPTGSPTASPTASPTESPTASPSGTPSASSTSTPSATPSVPASPTGSPTDTPSPTGSPTPTTGNTASATPTS